LPRYPGLERYILIEKMGDGAFSNVYKARDTQTHDEVAIKVVRKFEMNSNQVCPESWKPQTPLSLSLPNTASFPQSPLSQASSLKKPNQLSDLRAMLTFIRTSKNNQRAWRCAYPPSFPLLVLLVRPTWPADDTIVLPITYTDSFLPARQYPERSPNHAATRSSQHCPTD
jgi:hypothetical protein